MKNLTVAGQIFYFGTDIEFFDKITNYYAGLSKKIDCSMRSYSLGEIFRQSKENLPNIVFIDFSDGHISENKIADEVLFYKRIPIHKSVLFVSLFSDEDQKKKFGFLLTGGFHLSYIKGTETDTIFRDSFYIGFLVDIDFPRLACASKIDLPFTIGVCSALSHMTASEMVVETDIENLESSIELKLMHFSDFKGTTFPIKKVLQANGKFPMLASYQVSYPFPGPWEDFSENNLMPDTVETWIDNFSSEFQDFKSVDVIICSENVPYLGDVFLNLESKVNFNFSPTREEILPQILDGQPSLFIVDLSEEGKGNVSLELLDFLYTAEFRNSGQTPIVIVSNCPSTSIALQKLFLYQMILACPGKLDLSILEKLLVKLKSKNNEVKEQRGELKLTSSFRVVNVLQNIVISSLTEHEVTFYSEGELPYFSILHFELPIPFHAIIVPPVRGMQKRENKKHYMAFIHGLSEESIMILRKFVNQLIHSPLSELTPETVKVRLGEKQAEVVEANISSAESSGESQLTQEKHPVSDDKSNRKKLNGKSKL